MKNDKTQTYSDSNKTSVYGETEKRTKPSVHNLKIGDNIILNKKEYKIIEIVSESTGEAVIYKVEDNQQKIYALKLYYEFHDIEQEPNTEALSRIRNIEDVDILNLVDYGTGINKYKEKYCFEILDFAQGFDLLDVENLKQTYNPDFIEKEVIPQIFKGILKLHKNKIYHCDLKPQNVFFLDKNQKNIVVGDYGSAKTFEFDAEKDSRKTTTVKGTDFYLPPEQARGFISEKNDYYSFGMILLHLLYPDKLVINETETKSLSKQKLKQIIERQFEGKHIIDYNPKYKRINSLIAGLTLVDFNRRWGEKEVKAWIKGKSIDVAYRKEIAQEDSDKTLIFGEYTIKSAYDLRDYILNEKNWYADLIEDEDNREEFMRWLLNLHGGDRSMRSVFNRIIKQYSQEGIDFVADAVIRFFIPDHPVVFGLKTFDFANSDDLMKTTAEAFSYLINDLWKSSSEEDIQLYIFRYEFALRQLKDLQTEVSDILKILYEKLNVKEEMKANFYNYKVYAYTSVSKKSLNNIKQFLCEYMPVKISVGLIHIDKQDELHYKIIKTINEYFSQVGIENSIIKAEYKYKIPVNYPANKKSIEDFYIKTIYDVSKKICEKHSITKDVFIENDLKLFKNKFINDYRKLSEDLKRDYNKLKNELSQEIKKDYTINNYLKKNWINNFKKEIS